MSIATMSAKTHTMTPQDELIGSLTLERVSLLVRAAGAMSVEKTGREARYWLAHMLDIEVPVSRFDQVCWAFAERELLEDGDLEFWFGVQNTDSLRLAMQVTSEETIASAIAICAQRLATDLGLTA
jgi:hypothetical protein